MLGVSEKIKTIRNISICNKDAFAAIGPKTHALIFLSVFTDRPHLNDQKRRCLSTEIKLFENALQSGDFFLFFFSFSFSENDGFTSN